MKVRLRLKEPLIEAIQYDGTNDAEVEAFGITLTPGTQGDRFHGSCIEGMIDLKVGDWLLKTNGRIGVCEAANFAQRYEIIK